MKYIVDHDYHIHSQLSVCSRHPEQTPERILQYAKDCGLSKIVLTDHYWDSAVPGASKWYEPQNFDHIAQFRNLPQAEGIEFLFGCESDMDKHGVIGVPPERFDDFAFIIIPTTHLHMKGFTIREDDYCVDERVAQLWVERLDRLLDMDLPFHKMGIAHFTCETLAYYSTGTLSDVINSISDSDFFEFFERAAKCGIGIELNVHLEHASMPEIMRPYKIARQCGCKFYLGSDAHKGLELDGAPARFAAVVDALDLTEDDKYRIP